MQKGQWGAPGGSGPSLLEGRSWGQGEIAEAACLERVLVLSSPGNWIFPLLFESDFSVFSLISTAPTWVKVNVSCEEGGGIAVAKEGKTA